MVRAMSDSLIVTDNAPLDRGRFVYDEAAMGLAVDTWAAATSDPASPRFPDLRRDKTRVVLAFFDHIHKHPASVTPADVQAWQRALRRRDLAESTIYQHSSFLSSFYRWSLSEPSLARDIRANPVTLARPKAPRPYQSKQTKALSDDEVRRLYAVILERTQSDDLEEALIGKRDYALLLLYLYTGLRRREIIQLRWGDIELEDTHLTLATQTKGGFYRTLEVTAPSALAALRDYLAASGRWGRMEATNALWLAHDHAVQMNPSPQSRSALKQKGRKPEGPLTSHGFVKSLKQYAATAGVAHIHLHQTRHTFARMLGEEADSLFEVQKELGHRSIATTQVYLDKVTRKKDKFSRRIEERIGAGMTTRERATNARGED
jgi:integrase/recombinase XerD